MKTNRIWLCTVGVLLPFLLFPFSPLITFLFSIFSLLFYSVFLSGYIRRALSFLSIISLVYIFGSREYIDELGADLTAYYNAFLIIKDRPLGEVLFSFPIFGGGAEFGIVILYKLYALFSSKITAVDISIYNTIICSIGMLIWYESFGIRKIPKEYRSACMAFILIFISVTTFGYLQRQAIATVFVLFALEMKKNKYVILFTLLACIFHLTSLFVIFIWRFLLKRKLTIRFVLICFLSMVFFRFFFSYVMILFAPLGINKILFYVEMLNSFHIISYRFLILLFLLLLMNLVLFREQVSQWKTPIVILCMFHIIFIGVPMLSERINFIFLFLYGYFLFVTLYKKMLKALYVLFMVYAFYFTLEKTNIIKLPIDAYWLRYPMFSFEPFYYYIQ
ncbi:EpsG family protein [Capnocytophaga canis]|uniref:EpsG family protein n=1 Tax=Capnocytophaga canis TaxID=1848903 RepID=UPI00370D0A3E